ncbi:hypothetical protein HHI36_008855 [Cryptolaemus montrouzieri]|uniref:Uncharacterized protein n=1 Tax=Cryptolaemus montrouzieri TaxID=559131 RepID=A0ABD2MTQ7_9CUCU
MEEEITMTKKKNDSEFVDNTDEYTDDNIDEDIEEQHYGNRDMILNEEVTMRDSSSQDEEIDETMPTKYNKKNNQKLRLLGNKYAGMKTIINDNEEKIVKKCTERRERHKRKALHPWS